MPAFGKFAHPLRDAFRQRAPSLWVRWHLARCADSIEPEVALLKHIVPRGGVAVDIGANLGLYTRELARLADAVHAVEPSHEMARLLRRTSPANVVVHEMALSDRHGAARLRIPQREDGLIHSLASIEPDDEHAMGPCQSIDVASARLDSLVAGHVTFMKIDVEGHELKVLQGASGVLDRSHPIVLVEAEERHRPGAVQSIDDFFRSRGYTGHFLQGHQVAGLDEFDAALHQDTGALNADGSRKRGRHYVNNFFFFPSPLDGRERLRAGLRT